ncbi:MULTISPECIES: metal-dependent hydrolase family protein [unclassified Micromonospora]|uniref:metal-dependent hydrolase family protein n=1 Tax=unclassified Micromonospora TaxID=2617518 RepID=UPI003A872F2B
MAYSEAPVIDLRGATLLPGLIDGHVHVTAARADLSVLPNLSPYYVGAYAAEALRHMLARGFTTVRDCGGADYGLAEAVAQGLIAGPRLLYGGKALSQTGGHGDVRRPGRDVGSVAYCCPDFGRVCDGVPECRRAARDEIRKGAHHIKIMLGGGVVSPTDRIDSTQFALDEIIAIVEEARAAGRYVAGHAYTPEAINRGLQSGVRSIEHGNLLDASSIGLFRATGAFLVPTLITYDAIAREGRVTGIPEPIHRKVYDVLDSGLRALETAHRGGVNIVFGTDLLGEMQRHQLDEMRLRNEVLKPLDIIRSATSTAAAMLGAEGTLGVVAPGAFADLIAVDGDPLEDLRLLTEPDRRRRLLMAAGRIVTPPYL